MADEQYGWLDRRTAERLLRGESLEAVDAAGRGRAERLAKTLGALSAVPPPAGAELPGETVALAAFRKARADRVDDWVGGPAGRDAGARAALDHRSGGRSSDVGLVRIGGKDPDAPRPRRAHPLRWGLAAALAVGMVGGVAVVVGNGVLPFGEAEPDPAASAAVTPGRPFVTPSPKASRDAPTPDGATGQGSSRDTASGGSASPGDGTGTGVGSGSLGRDDRSGGTWHGAVSACRAVRGGEKLSTGRRRTLEGAAGGAKKVGKYCEGVLATSTSDEDATSTSDEDAKSGAKSGKGSESGQEDNEVKDDPADGEGRGSGKGDSEGRGGEDGHGSASSGGNGHHTNGGFAAPGA